MAKKTQVLRLYIIFIFCASLCLPLAAQDNATQALLEKFDTYRKAGLQEKIYVHTDKDYYVAGELLWMRLYYTDAIFHRPASLSKVAYAELLDAGNKPVLQAKLGLDAGGGNGSFFLPVGMASGNYTLRAYTNWMKNFGAAYFFEKNITIVNTQQPGTVEKSAAPKYNLHFFPEGGHLVETLPCKVAFSVQGQYGNGIAAQGYVYDSQHNQVATLKTLRAGMGNFSFTPLAGQSYTAELTLPNGSQIAQQLPTASPTGYTMSLTSQSASQLQIAVRATGTADAANSEVFLFIHTRGAIKIAQRAPLQNGVAHFAVDAAKLGDGINHCTLFNSARQPVCERLYFKYPDNKMSLEMQAASQVVGTREKINLNIAAGTSAGKDSIAMSVAVYRLDSLQQADPSTITGYLLLGSDLSGHIDRPDDYFGDTATGTVEAMDNLMLVHGWRRFAWQDVLQGKKTYFAFAPEYNGHRIYGKVVDNTTGKPAPDITGYLSVPGVRTQFRNAGSDAKGNIMFEMKDFYGGPAIIVQTDPSVDSNYHVEVENPFYASYSGKPRPGFTFPARYPGTLLDQSVGMQVQNIFNGKKQWTFTDKRTDTAAFYTKPNASFLLDRFTRFTTIEEIFREFVIAVNVRRRKGVYHLPVYNDLITNGMFDADPLLLLDGMPVFDNNKLMAYDALKLNKIEVVTRRYYYGRQAFDGIINFITYKGDLEGYELDPRATVIDYEALQFAREFYSPDYSTVTPASRHLPDFRSTLYWAPDITLPDGGRTQLQFYSADITGRYVAIAQALSANGATGTATTFFEVR